MRKLHLMAVFFLSVFLVLAGCSQSNYEVAPGVTKGPITVGSKIDTEGALLSQMMIQMLKKNNFDVVDKSQLGTTSIVRKALLSGEIDIYPEYTGNGAFFFDETSSDVWMDAQKGYERVKQLDKDTNQIVWLQPAPANNTWAIAVPKSLADKENLRSLDDLAGYVNKGGVIKLAGSEEFITSPVALPAFEKAYGFILKKEQLLSLSGGNTALTEKAAAEGTDGVNAAMAYGTDGSLSALGLVVLSDPRGVQPVYEPAPTVRGAIYDKYPELAQILNPVFASLGLETLQQLNARIAIGGEDAGKVAQDYLMIKKFL